MEHLSPATLSDLTAALAGSPPAEAARARAALAAGTYGSCVVCGEPIAEAALRLRPTLGRSAGCAEDLRAENEGRRYGICGLKPR